jgi:hypothetical protein
LDSFFSGYGLVVGSCKHGNELTGSIKSGDFNSLSRKAPLAWKTGITSRTELTVNVFPYTLTLAGRSKHERRNPAKGTEPASRGITC